MPSESSSVPVWLIVGGSRGIGLEFVKQIAESGAHVIATARELKQAPGLQTLLQKHDGSGVLQVVTLDITDPTSVKDAAAAIAVSHPQGIDYLVINAGVNDNHVGPSFELELDTFKRVFDVNVFGVFAAMQAFFSLLKVSGRKVVAVVSSAAATVSSASAAAKDPQTRGPFDVMLPAYNTSKGAVNRLTIHLANEHKRDGYIFTAIHPGMIQTDMAAPIMAKMDDAVISAISGFVTPVEVSVASQIALLKAATLESLNGRFVDWRGDDMPW